jgi:hypothetical protein
MTSNPDQEGRAKLSFDIDEEDDPEASKEAVERKIREISQQSGFTARAVARSAEKPTPVSKKAVTVAERPRRQRARTGRTHAFNTKIKPETYQQICTMADDATGREGRPVSLGEILERALECLAEREMRRGEGTSRP